MYLIQKSLHILFHTEVEVDDGYLTLQFHFHLFVVFHKSPLRQERAKSALSIIALIHHIVVWIAEDMAADGTPNIVCGTDPAIEHDLFGENIGPV